GRGSVAQVWRPDGLARRSAQAADPLGAGPVQGPSGARGASAGHSCASGQSGGRPAFTALRSPPTATSSPSRTGRRRAGQRIGLDSATEWRQWRPETAEGKRYARSDAARELGIDEDELGADAWKVVDASADAAGRRRHASSVGMS